jgi:hypothetical protein
MDIMKLKKIYTHDSRRQIWRILPTSNNKVVVEERDTKTKEVFFSCLEIESGKKILNEFQHNEKNWIGIETVCNDIIYFHKYGKPNMPAHKSIIAFDIPTRSILWQNDNYVFAFVYENKIYCYQHRFENRNFFALDYLTGNVVEDFGSDVSTINQLQEKVDEAFWQQNYFFPEPFNRNDPVTDVHQKYIQKILDENVVKGEISFIKINNLLLFNYHEISKTNTYTNNFNAVDLSKNKILVKEILDKNLVNLMPESFFVKDNFLFLIVDKTKLFVYQIQE